ncbi:unnamed protein product [Polarella glacialis]|uniref:RNA helicase n=1 Tax=Polarella glacialis TaxID=89957 RepID=A0A813ERF2_POLGL|nr:unnamed protein product [Polarella glacialis]
MGSVGLSEHAWVTARAVGPGWQRGSAPKVLPVQQARVERRARQAATTPPPPTPTKIASGMSASKLVVGAASAAVILSSVRSCGLGASMRRSRRKGVLPQHGRQLRLTATLASSMSGPAAESDQVLFRALLACLLEQPEEFGKYSKQLQLRGGIDKDIMDAVHRHVRDIWGGMASVKLMGSASYGTATQASDFDFYIDTAAEETCGATELAGQGSGDNKKKKNKNDNNNNNSNNSRVRGRKVSWEEMKDLERRLQEDKLAGGLIEVSLGRIALSIKRPGSPEMQLVPKISDYFNFEWIELPLLRGAPLRTESDSLLRNFYEAYPGARNAARVLKTLFSGVWVSCNLEHLLREVARRGNLTSAEDPDGSRLCLELLSWGDSIQEVLEDVRRDARSQSPKASDFWEDLICFLTGEKCRLFDPLQRSALDSGTWDQSLLDSFCQERAIKQKAPKRNPGEMPRQYQQECVERAIEANVIVSLGTGTGKTLIAVKVMEHFFEEGLVEFFLVPTRALVSQQAQYIRRHARCSKTVRVTELRGEMTLGWTAQDWERCVQESDVIVCTAEVLRVALVDRGFVSMSQISLLVLDECHSASGNDPMAEIMLDAFIPAAHRGGKHPRILGLTASFARGAAVNVDIKRNALEAVLQADMISPEVGPEHSPQQQLMKVDWDSDNLPDELAPLVGKALLNSLSLALGDLNIISDKGLEQIRLRSLGVLEQLGWVAFLFYIREGVVRQLEAKAILKIRHGSSSGGTKEDKLADLGLMPRAPTWPQLPEVQSALCKVADQLAMDAPLQSLAPKLSNKVEKLLKILEDSAAKAESDGSGFRAIVFVKEVSLTYPLANLINSRITRLQTGAISGNSSTTEKDRENTLQDFRLGVLDVLVSTDVLEEGLDVPGCGVVLRFDAFATTRSHIQGKGRARALGSVTTLKTIQALKRTRHRTWLRWPKTQAWV